MTFPVSDDTSNEVTPDAVTTDFPDVGIEVEMAGHESPLMASILYRSV